MGTPPVQIGPKSLQSPGVEGERNLQGLAGDLSLDGTNN